MAYSTRKKRGPKRKPESERASAWDHGNPRVQARAALFAHFHGASSKGFEMTSAGRLMLVGAFDGLADPPEAILSALLDYQNAYWGNYMGGPKVAPYERHDRAHDGKWEDLAGEWFEVMDGKLRDCGYDVRKAVHEATVNVHWFDEDSSWAAAIINRRFLDKDLPVAGEIATDGHSAWKKLELLRQGATALIGRQVRKAA